MIDLDAVIQPLIEVWHGVRDWVMACPKFVLPLGVMVGSTLMAVVGSQALWAIARFFFLAQSGRAEVRIVAGALARAVRAGSPLPAALMSAQANLRWPFPFRLRACARALESGQATSVVEAAIDHRVLPDACRATGRAAEFIGPGALRGWLDGLAEDKRSTDWTRTGAFSIAMLLAIVLMARGIAVLILPKWQAIMADLGVGESARFAGLTGSISFVADWWWLFALVALPSVWLAVVLTARRHWRRRQRVDRARVILAGIACGRSEAALAYDLQRASPAFSAMLSDASRDGDFSLLCRASGWDAATPAALTAAVDQERWRQARRESAWRVARTALIPLALAIPVCWICTALFGVLIDMIVILAEQAT